VSTFSLVIQPPDPTLRKMRLIATGLVVLMACLYVLARSFENDGSAWPWLRAFAEAAVVGGLADWFAVTALFRHPLGLPIPHTAIVRKEQERIGAAVASFVRKSFLSPEEVTRQWKVWQPLHRAAQHLSDPLRARQSLQWVLARVPAVLSKSDHQTLARFGAFTIRHGASAIPMSRLMTILLEGFLKSPGRRSLIAPILGRLSQSVAANREWVMDEASKTAKPQKLKIFDLITQAATSAVSGKAVEKFSAELSAASENEEHPLYAKIEEALAETASDLESHGGEQWEVLKTRLVEDPQTLETLRELVEKALKLLVESAQDFEGSGQLDEWSELLAKAAVSLVEDSARLEEFEVKAGVFFANVSGRYGPSAEKLIHKTVASWEADELIARLENQVGSDLQFIRVNGTLIGGLVGLLLHGLGQFIWAF